MAINPNILLSLRGPNLSTLGDNFAQGLQQADNIKNSRLNRKITLADLQAKEAAAQEQAKYQNTLRGLMQRNDVTAPQGQTAVIQGLAASGYGERVPEFQKTFQDLQLGTANIENKQADTAVKKTDAKTKDADLLGKFRETRNALVSDLAFRTKSIQDPAQRQALWKQGLQQIASEGLDVSEFSDQPVDDELNALEMLTMAPKDRFAEGREQQAFGTEMDGKKLDNTQKRQDLQKGGLEIQKLQKELDAFTAGGIDPEKAAAIEEKLRKEYIAQNKDFQAVSDSFGRIQAAGNNPSAAGDLALIFNYMKMLDPGSVVRESEFATAANSAGVPDRVRNQYNRILSGERLGVSQRKDFMDRAQSLYGSAQTGYKRSQGTYSGLSQRYKVDPSRVVIDLSRVSAEQDAGKSNAPPADQDFEILNVE